jgi:23S rRNA G2445 N2-methylase RlmL
MPKPADASVACFALTVPGLEPIAATEIEQELDAEVKKQTPGLIVFRVPELTKKILQLRTVEDVFLYAWGTDSLTYKAEDLKRIAKWTALEPDWPKLLERHHAIRPKPKGKPTYHLVAQMRGEHGYRRIDALKAMAKGLAGKFPASWQPVAEGAAIEFWLTIWGKKAICGVRLSDQSMRHRTYKEAHIPASLRPVVAAAMVRLADLQPRQWLLDPCCGAGTILGERLMVEGEARVLGGDMDRDALRAANTNLRKWKEVRLLRWDACQLPLRDNFFPCIVCNPPFGEQLGDPETIGMFYHELVGECNRVLKPDGRAILLVSNVDALQTAAWQVGWQQEARYRLRLLGQSATILCWRKP